MRELILSSYKSRFDKNKKLSVKGYSWVEVTDLLSNFKVTDEPFAQYCKMESLDKLAIKDTGYIIGGEMDPPFRKTFNLVSRDLLMLDADHLQYMDEAEFKETYGKYAYLIHSSHSHSSSDPRLRIVFPLKRSVTPEEYEALARKVAEMLDMDMFDDTTYQFSRIMFLPSVAADGEKYLEINDGEWLDPDHILSLYEDWEDLGSWPKSSREQTLRAHTMRAQNPFTKPEPFGSFNRAYTIPEAIIKFELPYEESGQGEGRYTLVGGSSADGAIYYPDDGHLFSHHESDPATGNHNAFDLVRLHKFCPNGDDTEGSTNVMQCPSMQQMVLLARRDPLVQRELALEMFDDCSTEAEEDEETGAEVPSVPKVKQITAESILEKIESHEGEISREDLDDLMNEAAVARLSKMDESRVGQAIKVHAGAGVTKADVIKDIRQIAKTGPADTGDIQEDTLDLVLKNHYHNGKTICCINGVFWTFQNGLWTEGDPNRILRKIDLEVAALRSNDKKEYRRLQQQTENRETSAISGALAPLFTRKVADLVSENDPMKLRRRFKHPVINTRNVEIHFHPRTGEPKVKKHNPSSFLGVRLGVDYDPEATCPEWNKFCGIIFRNDVDPEDSQRHLEEWMGYVIQMARWEKKFAIFVGYTDAGKTTIVEVLKKLLDDHYLEQPITNMAEENRSDFATYSLINKLLLVDEERSKTGLLPDGPLKMLAEEKSISANKKYASAPINFVARVHPLVVSNSWPRSSDISEAFTRRALVWEFKSEIPPEVRSDATRDAMMEEMPGILNNLIAGITRLRARGHFDIPLECEEAKEKWVKHSNPVARFVDEALIVDKDATKAKCMHGTDVYRHYELWASIMEGTSRQYIVKNKEFWDRMAKLGHPKSRTPTQGYRRVRGVSGLKEIEDGDSM